MVLGTEIYIYQLQKGAILATGYRPERISKNKYEISETRIGLKNYDQKLLEVRAADHCFH